MTTEPDVKGWCPGAWRPMLSGDGLVVRVRPVMAQLTADQALGICEVALQYGNGFIDLTNRANLQIRGVDPQKHHAVLEALMRYEFLDPDPETESRRNILVSPFWQDGDLTHRVARSLLSRLSDLPTMPAKVGIAVDAGPAPVLSHAPADFRIERSDYGLILRADGQHKGRPVTEETLFSSLTEMAVWFVAHMTPDCRRMAPVVAKINLPETWCTQEPVRPAVVPPVGPTGGGMLAGFAFGQIDAQLLSEMILKADVRYLRVTPWRAVLLEGTDISLTAGFITGQDDPILTTDACPGAPACPQATVETRDFARLLAPLVEGSLHVSGCAKGCAKARASELTLVGRDGLFDLVKKGRAGDTPRRRGLRAEDILRSAANGDL